MVTCIYKITSPSEKIYIGQTTDLFRRHKEYLFSKCKNQPKLYNSIKKYGFEKHSFEVIDYCYTFNSNERERYWQEYYNVLSSNGLNCKLTETNDRRGKLSIDLRKKIGKSNIGKHNHDDRVRKIISDTHKGKKISEKHIESMSKKLRDKNKGENNPFYGKKHTKDSLIKISIKSTGSNNGNSKTILDVYNGIYYETLKELAENNNISAELMRYRIKRTKTRYIYT